MTTTIGTSINFIDNYFGVTGNGHSIVTAVAQSRTVRATGTALTLYATCEILGRNEIISDQEALQLLSDTKRALVAGSKIVVKPLRAAGRSIIRWWYRDPLHRAAVLGSYVSESERNRIRDDTRHGVAQQWAEELAGSYMGANSIETLQLTRHRLTDNRTGTRGERARELACAMRVKFGFQRYSKSQYDAVRRWGSEQKLVTETVVRFIDRERVLSAALVLYFAPDDETLAHQAVFNTSSYKRLVAGLPGSDGRA